MGDNDVAVMDRRIVTVGTVFAGRNGIRAIDFEHHVAVRGTWIIASSHAAQLRMLLLHHPGRAVWLGVPRESLRRLRNRLRDWTGMLSF